MARVARVVVAGYPHHITQRGNRQQDVFLTDGDRAAYLRFLKKYSEIHGLAIWAYCLMSNHVHLVGVPARDVSLGLAMRDAHTVYSMWFNSRTELSGHVWQGRFYSCPLDEHHLWAAVRYVERNPVRAGLVERAEEYQWSSARSHCGLSHDPLLAEGFPPDDAIEDWKAWLRDVDDAPHMERIRIRTHTGRPCGAADFVGRLEALTQIRLVPGRRGRRRGGEMTAGEGE